LYWLYLHHKEDLPDLFKIIGKQMTKLENVAERTGKAEGITRKIWLFGLGIYCQGVEKIQSKFEVINGVKACLLEKLVSKGETMTADTKESVNENIKEQTDVDKRVADVRKKLGLDTSDTDTKIAELSQKINALTEIVGKLS
jgi:hypothetical protein